MALEFFLNMVKTFDDLVEMSVIIMFCTGKIGI